VSRRAPLAALGFAQESPASAGRRRHRAVDLNLIRRPRELDTGSASRVADRRVPPGSPSGRFSRALRPGVGRPTAVPPRPVQNPARSVFFRNCNLNFLIDLLTCKMYRKITVHPFDLIQTSVDFLLKCLSNSIGPTPIGSI
jgi:hypothetical protein